MSKYYFIKIRISNYKISYSYINKSLFSKSCLLFYFYIMDITNKYSNFVLYSYWRSSCSWRVRCVLNYKNIPYTISPVHLIKDGGQQKSSEYKLKNPTEKVPCLEFKYEGKTTYLSESVAICEFLEEIFPEKSIFPTDPLLKAKVRMICLEIASGIQPLQNLSVMNKIESDFKGNKAEWSKFFISKGLEALEITLNETRGKFCVGDIPTLADAFLVPQIYSSRSFNVDFNVFPNILEIESNLKSIDSFDKARPENQIDAEL